MLIVQLLLLLSSPGSACFGQAGSDAGVQRPNIILIMTDDHTKQATSVYDPTLIRTPNIDRIGMEGIRFDRAYVTNSICAPSRAVILTGKYSHLNGLRDNADVFDSSQVTFPKLLRQAGYRTFLIGKWHLKTPPSGFDFYQVFPGQGQYYNPDMIVNGDTFRMEGYATDLVTDLAIEQISKRDDRDSPFCLLLYHKAPHRNWMPDVRHLGLFREDLPLPATYFDDYATRSSAPGRSDMRVKDLWYSFDMKLQPRFYEKEDGTGGMEGFNPVKSWENTYLRFTPEQKTAWDAHYDSIGARFADAGLSGRELAVWKYQQYIKDYLRCVHAVDENVGRVLDYLDENGMTENTLVIYTSDQGFYLGEHGWYDKRFMYEESFSTPMLMRCPRFIPPGTSTDRFALNLDIAPTILDLAGAELPPEMQGRSLRPLFAYPGQQDWRTAVYYHYYQSAGWHHVPRHRGVMTDRYKLIHFYALGEWELYDLAADPGELQNLYGREGMEQVTADLKERLAALRANYGDEE
jgi:arylsulfatase A-like enzyme